MTPEEHQLLITMLKEQQVAIAVLTEILRSRGVLQDGDLVAFDQLLRTSGKMRLIEGRVPEAYREFAKILGVTVGELPEDLL